MELPKIQGVQCETETGNAKKLLQPMQVTENKLSQTTFPLKPKVSEKFKCCNCPVSMMMKDGQPQQEHCCTTFTPKT